MTTILEISGILCVAISAWVRYSGWQFLKLSLPEIYRSQIPRKRLSTALLWIGFGLFVLSQWRGCSGQ